MTCRTSLVSNEMTLSRLLTSFSPPCSGVVLEKVCEYFCYHEKHKDQTNVPDMDIPPELCLELLMAADYLDT